MDITRELFTKVVGVAPEQDDLERCNCKQVGELGHTLCGWCDVCNKPRFMCMHSVTTGTDVSATLWQTK